MQGLVRDHVPAATAMLTAASLALVFGAVLGYLPGGSLPRPSAAVLAAIPTVNAAISLLAIGTIVSGWRFAKARRFHEHRAAMLTAAGLFATFLALYLYRLSILGTTPFGGPDAVYRYVYLPVLVVHVTLAIVCIPLLYYVLLLGLSRPVAEIPATRHRRIGRVAASLWLVSFTLGIVVYLLLYVAY